MSAYTDSTSRKRADACTHGLLNRRSQIGLKSNHVHDCEHFEHILSLLNLLFNLLDHKYRISIVDLFFDNC